MAKYGALARGDTDMYLRFPPAGYREKVWDHAAGAVLVAEAGGVVSDGAVGRCRFTPG
jgi:3'-phosphoadenosine 5'-phosphosulfate (PAPS) 3'-phosphatase